MLYVVNAGEFNGCWCLNELLHRVNCHWMNFALLQFIAPFRTRWDIAQDISRICSLPGVYRDSPELSRSLVTFVLICFGIGNETDDLDIRHFLFRPLDQRIKIQIIIGFSPPPERLYLYCGANGLSLL